MDAVGQANPDLAKVSTQPPFRPKATEFYVFECEAKFMEKRSWIYDGYRWRNNGKHKHPKPNPMFEKTYYLIDSSESDAQGYRRCCYIPINKEYKYMVVHYLSEETSSEPGFGKFKRNRGQYTTTRYSPDTDLSLLGSHFTLTGMSTEGGSPEGYFGGTTRSRSETIPCADHSPIPSTSGIGPRSFVPVAIETGDQNRFSGSNENSDVKTDTWVDEKGENVFKFSSETFSSIMSLCYHMRSNDYFWSFNSFPEIVLVFGSCELLKDLDELLLNSADTPGLPCLSYTTSPCLDGFYVSVLSIIHPKFISPETKSPVILPLAFMIHQDKSLSTHRTLFNIIKKHLTAVQDPNKAVYLVVVSDYNADATSAIEECFPECANLLSLAHVKKEGQSWLTRNMQSKRGDRYLSDLECMLKACTKVELDSIQKGHREHCSRSWLNFFEANLQDDVLKHAACWAKTRQFVVHPDILEDHQSPALEQVLDDLELCHDATMDKLVQCLYLLQRFLINEIHKARGGFGSFRLLTKYRAIAVDPRNLKLDQNVVPPIQIVKSVMDGQYTQDVSGAADQGEIIQVKQEEMDEESNSIMVVTRNFSDSEDDTEVGESWGVQHQRRRPCSSSHSSRSKFARKF